MSKNKKLIAKNTIKMLSDGKVKIKKGKKVDLTPFMEKTLSKTSMGYIDGSGRRGRRPKDLELGVNNLLLPAPEALRILASTSTDADYTIVDIVRLKDANTFDLTEDSIKGEILRGSTLGGCYKAVKKHWLELNVPKVTDKTAYLYFPELVSFMNSDTGDVLKMPFKFNYLMISVPSISRFGYDSMDIYLNNVVADIMDAVIEVGSKNIILDPFSIKAFREHDEEISTLFNTIVSSDKVKNYLDTVTFAIPNDNEFITFITSQKNILTSKDDAKYDRIKVVRENNTNVHIYDITPDEDDEDDIKVIPTNVKKDGTLDIDAIVDSSDDDEDEDDD